MKKIMTIIATLMLTSASFAQELNTPDPIQEAIRSRLDKSIEIENFGQIKYRGPLTENNGPVVVLFHGIYGGASHRAFREIYPLLDSKGARVYMMDLPGAGESSKPRKKYTIEEMDLFVKSFLESVVKVPATVVTESLLGSSALKVSQDFPQLFRRIVLLSPTGIITLGQPPSDRENALFDRVFNNNEAGLSLYQNFFTENSLKFFLERAYYNNDLVDEARLAESRMFKNNLDQRWLTFSFVGGQIFRPFTEAANGVFVPVKAIFGKEAEAVGFEPDRVERAFRFKEIRPDFEYVELEKTGQAVQRENPESVAKHILDFSVVD